MLPLPVRLTPGQDLRAALQALCPGAGFVLQGIGSLSEVQLRLAGAAVPTILTGDYEILTLAGTLGPDGAHLHISIADAGGRVLGGHVAPGCIVRTTAEVLIVQLPAHRFSRAFDAATGYPELHIGEAPHA